MLQQAKVNHSRFAYNRGSHNRGSHRWLYEFMIGANIGAST